MSIRKDLLISSTTILTVLVLMLIILSACKTQEASLKRPSFEYGFINSISAFINTPSGKEVLIFIPDKRNKNIVKGMKFYAISGDDQTKLIEYILSLEDYIQITQGVEIK